MFIFLYFVVALVAFGIGFIIGVCQSDTCMRKEAIKNKAAHYCSDEEGNCVFKWGEM